MEPPSNPPPASDWGWLGEIWNYQLFALDGSPVTPGQVVIALGVIVVGLALGKIISRRLGRAVGRRFGVGEGPSHAVEAISFYLLLALTLLLALETAGVPLTVFTILGGAVALGVGFGSQNLMANFISGLILLFERPIKVGDLVSVQGIDGKVVRIGARATVIATYQGISHLVPNSILLEQPVTNWHLDDTTIAGSVTVGAAYGSDTATVRDILLAAAAAEPAVLSTREPLVLFNDFGDNALAFELIFWTEARSALVRRQVESRLRFAIDTACREAGVTIAFPQRDVHLDTLAPLQVELTGRRSND